MKDYGFIVLIVIALFRIIAGMVVAGVIATYIGLNGLFWWCSVVVMFLVINGVLSGIGVGK